FQGQTRDVPFVQSPQSYGGVKVESTSSPTVDPSIMLSSLPQDALSTNAFATPSTMGTPNTLSSISVDTQMANLTPLLTLNDSETASLESLGMTEEALGMWTCTPAQGLAWEDWSKYIAAIATSNPSFNPA